MKYGLLVFSTLVCAVNLAGEQAFDASLFGEVEARAIGPAAMSGRITDIEGTPDGSVILVGTAGGGVWKSENWGITFKSIFDDHIQSIGCICLDPRDSDVIWVGTGEINTRNSVGVGAGVYRSQDGGKTWTHKGLPDSERIGAIVVDPHDSQHAFVAVLGALWCDREQRGLFETRDAGDTWKPILQVDDKTGCIDVDMDPQDPQILFAAFWQVRRWPYFFESGGPGSGLYRSLDGGANWTRLEHGLPHGELGRIDVAIAPTRPNRVYAMVESESTVLYRSDDLGQTWERMNSDFSMQARPFYLSTIVVDPSDFDRVYNPSFQVTVSDDGGRSFMPLTPIMGGSVHPDMQALWINPANADHLLIGTDGGVYESLDRGKRYRFLANLPVSQFYHVSVDQEVPYHVYGGLQDNGSWRGPSHGRAGIRNRDWLNLGGGDGFHAIPDPHDAQIVYWEFQEGNAYRLNLDTMETKGIRPYAESGMEKDRFNWNTPLTIGSQSGALYIASQYLYRSTDRGETWTRLSEDLTTNDKNKQRQEESGGLTPDTTSAENHCTLVSVAESPLDTSIIWVGSDDGQVHVTRDQGQTWTAVVDAIPDLPANTYCSSIEPGRHQAEVAYVTFDGHRTGDMNTYLFKTTDAGKTWKPLHNDEIHGYAFVVRQDPVNPDLLFLGTSFGLYVSFDDGISWVPFRGGLPPVEVRDMVFQEREADLVLATHGRGIYIVDDITPLRHLTPEVMSAKAAILPARPSRADLPSTAQEFLGDDEFVGRNHSGGVNITYFLKKRHLFGDMRLEIYDDQDNLIKTLPGGKRKGINRVYWNMRLKPPKTAVGGGLTPVAFFGPIVKEGDYTIKLIKGKETFESTVTLLPSRLNPHSKEDRLAQFQTVMALYQLQEDLAFMGDALTHLIQQGEQLIDANPPRRLSRELQDSVNAWKELRSVILIAEARSIFADKPRLREEVVQLYGDVSNFTGRPSQNQLQRKADLEARTQEVKDRYAPLSDTDSLNQKLLRSNLEPLQTLDRMAWENGDMQIKADQPIKTSQRIRTWLQRVWHTPAVPLR